MSHPSEWDTPRTQAFAGRLVRRREVPWGLSPGGLGEDLSEQASERAPGWGWLRFAEGLGEARAEAGIEVRFAWEFADRTERVPAPVREGLNHNQKPFHLWNVERIEEKGGLGLRPVEPYRLGGAAADPEARGMPREFPTATGALEEERERAERERAAERAEVEARRRVWRQSLPFGRAEEAPEVEPREGR